MKKRRGAIESETKVNMNIKKIVVLGAGTMGPGIAQILTMAGPDVCLYDIDKTALKKAKSILYTSLKTFAKQEMIKENDIERLYQKITYTTDLQAALKEVDMVVEAIAEKAEIKTVVYKQLDELLPETVIIASNTSFLNIFQLMPKERLPYTIITHWYSPPTIIPLVEVCPNDKTKEGIVDVVCELLKKGGKTPVTMKKFIQGYIVNRIQMCINQELYYLMDNDYCTAQDIDEAVKASFVPRAMVLGLLQRADFAGLHMTANNYRNKSYTMPPAVDMPKTLKEHLDKEETGVAAGKGFYDYIGKDLNELYAKRDEQLFEAFRLQKKIMENPL